MKKVKSTWTIKFIFLISFKPNGFRSVSINSILTFSQRMPDVVLYSPFSQRMPDVLLYSPFSQRMPDVLLYSPFSQRMPDVVLYSPFSQRMPDVVLYSPFSQRMPDVVLYSPFSQKMPDVVLYSPFSQRMPVLVVVASVGTNLSLLTFRLSNERNSGIAGKNSFCPSQLCTYVLLRLRVQNAVPAQPCVGKYWISLILLNFLHCNFWLWFKTP